MNASTLARETVARAWCDDRTKHLIMEPALAEVMAEILDDIWTKPWLGNATTGELLEEIKARVDVNYSTVSSGEIDTPALHSKE